MAISELSRAAAATLVGCASAACSVWVETPGETSAASADLGGEAPGPLDLEGYSLVDLSHAFGDETVYWPTDTAGFALQELAFGETEGATSTPLIRWRRPSTAAPTSMPLSISSREGPTSHRSRSTGSSVRRP